MKYLTTIGEKTYTIEINEEHHLLVDGVKYDLDLAEVSGDELYSLLINNQSYEAFIHPNEDEGWRVLMRGDQYDVKVVDERAARLAKSAGGVATQTGDYNLKSPMPGLIVNVPVAEGQAIKKGDILIILESMKMQNELKSPRDGTVVRIKVKGSDTVEQNQVLLTIV